jgi:hypothetical protein
MDKLKRTDQRESYCYASVAQRIEQPAFTRASVGSSPTGGTEAESAMLAYFAREKRGVATLTADGEWIDLRS